MNIPAPSVGRRSVRGSCYSAYQRCLGVLALLLWSSGPAFAVIPDSVCISDALSNPTGNFCTANDVRITEFEVMVGPTECQAGDLIDLQIRARIESGPDRYGIGLWFNEDGLGAKTAGSECSRDILTPAALDNASCDSGNPAGLGDFWNANGDLCGDVTSSDTSCPNVVIEPCSEGGGDCAVHYKLVTLEDIVCQDSNGDNIADISSCTSWVQGDDDVCNIATDAIPGTSSKCSCDIVNAGDIFVGCADNDDCSDGNYCNGAEVCNTSTHECGPGTPPVCNDGVSCTVDSCNETTDSCDYTPNDAVCNDGAYCNGVETCDATNGCQAGTPPNCGDGVSCTVDTCNEGTDSCDNTPDDSVCNDGAYCNGVETCDATNDCQAGTAPNCSDGVSCTVDTCNEGTDSCDNTPNDSVCNDGAYCNGVETCDATNDCQAGTPPSCGDGVDCTVDACNEDTDSCDNTPDNSACDDGLFCNGDETCDAVEGCAPGTPMDVGDEIACTLDECNEELDQIIHTPFDGACDDGNVCNGDEICDGLNGCMPGENAPEGEACGDQTDTVCTDPDTCDGDGICLNNNEVCGAVTDSALCEFDVEPDKGVCVNGDETGPACSLSDPECPDDFTCVESNEFLLGFNIDGKNKKAFRAPYSNPGQFYYNAFYDGNASGGDGDVIAIVVPWPFITQGETPLHVYDGDGVGTLETCFMPGEALVQEKYIITLDDWIDPSGNPGYLSCDQVDDLGESGYCTILVDIPQALIDAVPSKLLYINLHLDYGLKGNWTDALPPFGTIDLYDPGASVSPWGSRDALQDTNPGNGPVAIQDCTDYSFSHYDENGLLFEDSAVNLNFFKANGKKPE